MAYIRNIIQKLKIQRQIKINLKNNAFNRRQFKKSLKEHQKRELDIHEILSREYSDNVVVDAYEYCMRKYNWDPSVLENGSIKDFSLCILFQGEVDNGGVSQFLSSSSGDMYEETVTALKKIDKEFASLLIETLNCFSDGVVPRNCERRNDLIERFDEITNEHLLDLDKIAYDHNNYQKYYDFLQANKNDFLNF